MENTTLRASNTLLSKGVKFEVETKGLLRFLKKTTSWTIKPSVQGTLFEVSRIYLENELDVAGLDSNPMNASNKMVVKANKMYAVACAIAVLNNKWGIRLFKNILGNFFFWNIDSNTMLKIMTLVVEQNNVLDFIHTIKLTSGIARIVEKTERPEAKTEVKMSPDEQGG